MTTVATLENAIAFDRDRLEPARVALRNAAVVWSSTRLALQDARIDYERTSAALARAEAAHGVACSGLDSAAQAFSDARAAAAR